MSPEMKPLIVLFMFLSLSLVAEAKTCGPLQVNFCGSVGYTMSDSPEGVDGYYLRDIRKIVETGCDPDVATLMCRVAVPECGADKDMRLKPCRSLCERVKSSCEAPMKLKKLFWPYPLKCGGLPEERCIKGSMGGVCEPIEMNICKGLSYNMTVMPNALGHWFQEDAGLVAQTFSPLIQVGCSPELKDFLCSLHFPECVNGSARAPCRRQCERSRAGCSRLMREFGFEWPEGMNCEKFNNDACDPDDEPTDLTTAAPTQAGVAEINARQLLHRLHTEGVEGNSLTRRTANQLLILTDTDKSGGLNPNEYFNVEQFVAAARREYVEMYKGSPPAVTEDDLLVALVRRGLMPMDRFMVKPLWRLYKNKDGNSIDFDDYVAVVSRLQVLTDRFNSHLLNLPYDCQVGGFSHVQFINAAIV